MSEIGQLELDADFVILSACNTAASDGGDPDAGALSGLAQAFFYAGARALLVSHWDVISEAAVRLTTGLIEAEARDPGSGWAEALRQSMLNLMNDDAISYAAHPGAWAAFVLVGE
jgi:CHAT domain-containing protein